MNYLAHSLFGFNDHALVAGQFCGDFVRGRNLERFPGRIETGIRLHRHLDHFTDTHAVLKDVRHQIRQVPLRFSGIVTDVLFDHYLACRWHLFSKDSLDQHAQFVHQSLGIHRRHLPDSLKRFSRILEHEKLLQRNVDLAAIEFTLKRIASRSDRFGSLQLSRIELEELGNTLIEPFDSFYPDLLLAAKNFLELSDEDIFVSGIGDRMNSTGYE